MPSGDAQRVWFPEMLKDLADFWQTDPSMESLIQFCDQMTELRACIRHRKKIKPIKMYCSRCQAQHQMKEMPVSIRSALFALKNIESIELEQFKELERQWRKHRKQNDLDAYGNPNQPPTKPSGNCKKQIE